MLQCPNKCSWIKIYKLDLQIFTAIAAGRLDTVRESAQLKVEIGPRLLYFMIDAMLELMNEDEKSDALELLCFDATENGREGLDDQGAEFQLSKDIQGL